MHDTMLEQGPMVESIHEESEQKKFFVEPTPTPLPIQHINFEIAD